MAEHVHTHGRQSENGPIVQCPRCTPLQARIAELERQRGAVLELHQPRVIEGLDRRQIVTDYCAHDDEVMPCPTAAIYGGGE